LVGVAGSERGAEVAGVWGETIAELEGTPYLLVNDDVLGRVLLYDLAGEVPAGPLEVADASYKVTGRGLALLNGELLYCVARHEGSRLTMELLRITPSTGDSVAVALATRQSELESRCHLVRGPDRILAAWTEGTRQGGLLVTFLMTALLDPADGTVVAGPRSGPPGSTVEDVAFDGRQFVAIAVDAAVFLYPISASTAAVSSRRQLPPRLGDEPPMDGVAIASDGTHLFVATTPQTPGLPHPRELVLRKLAELVTLPETEQSPDE
jgi:hypothetical protein